MRKVLIVDTAYPINSRTNKFRSSLSHEYSVKVLAWDRAGAQSSDPKGYILFKMRSAVGNRLKKLVLFPLFILFGIKTFLKFKPDILFLSHWDSLFLGCLMKIFRPKVKLIYDCLDMPAAGNKYTLSILKLLESFCLNFVDLTIFASRYFPELYNKKSCNIVFENYPSKSLIENGADKPEWYSAAENLKSPEKTVVSWVGVVRYPSVLKRLVDSFQELDMQLFIFGDGPSLDFAKKLVSQKGISDKVYFWGRYGQDELPYIYSISDFIWAAYPTDNLNAVYAISNKFFECSMFERIPIISSRTRMADDLKGQYSSNVILVDEFDTDDIQQKLVSAASGGVTFKQYQEIQFWEARSKDLMNEIRKL
ncbi:hypothetical protein CWC33_02910 [Idiomarina sp. X4]|uniref:glycosyltransferase n=1 Tax=Idiomarina sp. X4 TaxID=2055892 RepID=UPI000C2853B1|nr:glycosyltransferase [Idiomarina sp. X4]ATZ72704.1 hypothetical protein CWC33_02910 [Idiomarina sp. X4]